MASNAVTIAALLSKAADIHPRVVGQPTDDDIYKMEEILGPILHNAKYDMIVVPGIVSHNLVGLFQPIATYVDTWNDAFVFSDEARSVRYDDRQQRHVGRTQSYGG